MSGTFYHAPAPGEPPFVKIGDKVTKGQPIGIIEAMKLMNEIEVPPPPLPSPPLMHLA
jgi:acetyl-CoA carboxylase biotin carboxyl carrier protein